MKTKFTEITGVQYPIMQGGMMRIGTAELAAAVSNAGALGTVTAGNYPTGEDLRKAIELTKSLTDKPFAVNLTFILAGTPPPFDDYIDVIIETGVKIIETAGKNPSQYMERLKAAGIVVIHKCTTVKHAIKAEQIGCDFVSVDGIDCSGHPGEEVVPNSILIPATLKKVKIPVIASGGIANGKQLVASLALGAEGVNMGTRFSCTVESPYHENFKQKMVDSTESDTALILKTVHNTARVYKNSIAVKVMEIESRKEPADFYTEIYPLIMGKKATEAMIKGDTEGGMWTAGPVMGLIDDVPTCKQLVQNIMSEARETIENRLAKLV
jgi:NADH:quinone reductase (non-electrogenic)